METQHTTTPSTPHFDSPHLSELPATSQSQDCIPRPEPPMRTPGLLDYSLGLLTGAALVLIIDALSSDDTPNHANQED